MVVEVVEEVVDAIVDVEVAGIVVVDVTVEVVGFATTNDLSIDLFLVPELSVTET